MLNKETGELRDRYSFNSGQPRGPGLYDFPVTEEWLETREPLILAACGALAQANPVKIIGEHCQTCDLRLTCRDNIYNRISKKEEQQIANVMQEIEEEL